MVTKSQSTPKKQPSAKKQTAPLAETPQQSEIPQQSETPQPTQISASKPVPAAVKHKLATPQGDYGGVQVVTSNRLKRRFCNNGYLLSMFLPDTIYTRLSILGLEAGITIDEVMRALVEAHLAGSDQITTLKLFAPALQV